MSNSRPNYNLKKEQAFTNILYQLMHLHNDKKLKIIGWGNKIQGYGIKQTSFDNFKEKLLYRVDERIFRNNKKDLLDKKFIRVFDKSTHTKHGPYYSITPLGLFYLFQKIDKITNNEVNKMFNVLSFYSSAKTQMDNKSLKFFTEEQKLNAIKYLYRYCKFDINDERTIFTIYIPLLQVDVIFLEARIQPNDIHLNTAQLVTADLPALPTKIDDDEFNYQCAFTLEYLLCYYLYDQIKNKKEILKLSKKFQQNINSVTYMLGLSLQLEMDEISKLRKKTFGAINVIEVQKIIKLN